MCYVIRFGCSFVPQNPLYIYQSPGIPLDYDLAQQKEKWNTYSKGLHSSGTRQTVNTTLNDNKCYEIQHPDGGYFKYSVETDVSAKATFTVR